MDFQSRSCPRDVCPAIGRVCQHGWPQANHKPLLTLDPRKPQGSQGPSDSFSSSIAPLGEGLNRRNFLAASLSAATCCLVGNNPPPLPFDRCLIDGNPLGASRPNGLEARLLSYALDLTLSPKWGCRVINDASDPTLLGWWLIVRRSDNSHPQLVLLCLGRYEYAVDSPLIAARLTNRLHQLERSKKFVFTTGNEAQWLVKKMNHLIHQAVKGFA